MYQSRKIRDYQWIENCHDGAFANARDTLKARIVRFGQSSPDVEAWTLAQVAVFRNCNEEALVLPEPAPSSADSAILADRAYQTAAAYFYATRYEEAGQRFRAIAADGSSPWRKYGRYLAGRSNIRMSTVMLEDAAQAAQRLTAAEADLKAVLDDAAAAGLHDSARGLLDFIAVRLRPVDRLHAASRTLTTSETRSDQALVDFQRLMDRFVGDRAEYPYASIDSRPELTKGDDLVDWILAMQGTGDEALAHAIARWKETRRDAVARRGHVETAAGAPGRRRPDDRGGGGGPVGAGVRYGRVPARSAADRAGQTGRCAAPAWDAAAPRLPGRCPRP